MRQVRAQQLTVSLTQMGASNMAIPLSDGYTVQSQLANIQCSLNKLQISTMTKVTV